MQRLRRLSGRRAARLEEGAFVIEGPTLVREALAAGLGMTEVFVAPTAEPELVAAARGAGATVRAVDADVLSRAVDTVTPQPIAAIAPRIEVQLDEAMRAAAAGPLALLLVDVNDPGNAGTLVRAAEASGAATVLFLGDSVDVCNPKCVRASAGSLFHIPVASGGDPLAVLERLAEAGVPSAGAVVRGGSPYDQQDLRGPVAIVVGSEAHGLPSSIVDTLDQRLTIPMAGRAESLNVAMAGAVLCFEALRQRRSVAP